MKIYYSSTVILIIALLLTGCSYFEGSNLQNAGMLMETEVDANAWNAKGYKALEEIEKSLRVDVFYKENINTEDKMKDAIDEFIKDGVNLIIGHGNIYGTYFVDISKNYPDVHFVYTNGGEYNSSVTSLNFNSHAMGFFSGMAAAEKSVTNHVGVIASYSWQPELEGFYEGVKYHSPETYVSIDYVRDWTNEDYAIEIYESLKKNNVDVIYPASDGFNEKMIELAARDGIYSIGYTRDQSGLAPEYVLTSTIQHIDEIYYEIAKEFNRQGLNGEIRDYDFKDEVISLGTLNDSFSENFVEELLEGVERYKETNLLPHEKE